MRTITSLTLAAGVLATGFSEAHDVTATIREYRPGCDPPAAAIEVRNHSWCKHYKVQVDGLFSSSGCTSCGIDLGLEVDIAPGQCLVVGRTYPTCDVQPDCCARNPHTGNDYKLCMSNQYPCDNSTSDKMCDTCDEPYWEWSCSVCDTALVTVEKQSLDGQEWDGVDPATAEICNLQYGDYRGCIVKNCCDTHDCDLLDEPPPSAIFSASESRAAEACDIPACPAFLPCPPGECEEASDATYAWTGLKSCKKPDGYIEECLGSKWIAVKSTICENQCDPPCECAGKVGTDIVCMEAPEGICETGGVQGEE